MPYTYEVKVDGKSVWSDESETYRGTRLFPAEHRDRPVSGTVELFLNGEVIGRQVSQADEDAAEAGTGETP